MREEIQPIKTTGPDWKKLIRELERDIINGFLILAREAAVRSNIHRKSKP